jgi:ABC-type transporter Mla subunit MlaD
VSRLRVPTLRSGGRPASQTRGRTFLATLGGIGVAVAILLLYIGYNSPSGIPGRSYYNLQAAFDNADNLTSSYQVRIGGRLVGQVLRPRVEDGKAVVDLQLDPKIKPLLSDSTLRVRPRSPVGVRFVELNPGTHGHPLGEDGRIPSSQTSATVQLDQALGTLDADRRKKAQVLLNELGVGFAGRGDDINAAQKAAPPALRNLTAVAREVNARRSSVEGLVHGADSAAAAADPVRDAIATGFRPEARALQPFIRERDALRSTLTTAPASLRAVQSGLARTAPLLTSLERFGKEATPAFRQARPSLSEADRLLASAGPGLDAARKTLGFAQDAVNPTLALLKTVDPVLPDIENVLGATKPILDELAPRGCDIHKFMGDWAESVAFGDGFSNWLRFNFINTPESIQGYPKKNQPGIWQSPYPAPCEVDRQTTKGIGR